MRVITGKYKGRNLVAPKEGTRPTLDRTKETLFNIINNYLYDATVLDLFAGSGQLGIECLSRGAKRVIFCDNSKQAVQTIKANCAQFGVAPEVFFGDFKVCLQSVTCKFDVILLDPPYEQGLYEGALQLIAERELLAKDGVVVCEHLTNQPFADVFFGLTKTDERKMGTATFTFYKEIQK